MKNLLIKNVSGVVVGVLVIFMVYPSGALRSQAALAEEVKESLKNLIDICNNAENDPNAKEMGMFYRAAPYIVYRGVDEKRRWKDVSDYSSPDERLYVDVLCQRVKRTFLPTTAYRFGTFQMEIESEGVWYSWEVIYQSKTEKERKAIFSFLNIKGKYALGDID